MKTDHIWRILGKGMVRLVQSVSMDIKAAMEFAEVVPVLGINRTSWSLLLIFFAVITGSWIERKVRVSWLREGGGENEGHQQVERNEWAGPPKFWGFLSIDHFPPKRRVSLKIYKATYLHDAHFIKGALRISFFFFSNTNLRARTNACLLSLKFCKTDTIF